MIGDARAIDDRGRQRAEETAAYRRSCRFARTFRKSSRKLSRQKRFNRQQDHILAGKDAEETLSRFFYSNLIET